MRRCFTTNNGKLEEKGEKESLIKMPCLLTSQKKTKQQGKCREMFCMVENRFYLSQVSFIRTVFRDFRSSSSFQKCQTQTLPSGSPACSVTVSTTVTAGGSCNMFGVCRSGSSAQLDHPACRLHLYNKRQEIQSVQDF